MATELRLPRFGEEMQEGTVSRWLKQVGEPVTQGEPLVEVETEKVIVEVEAPVAGVLLEIVAPEHQVVPVNGLLGRIGKAADERIPLAPVAAAAFSRPSEQAGAAAPVQAPAPAGKVLPLPKRSSPPPAPARGYGGAPASPLARRVAEQAGLDLAQVTGSGIAGKIVLADLQPLLATDKGTSAPRQWSAEVPHSAEAAAPGAAGAPVPGDSTATQAYEDLAFGPLRRTIARRMAESKTTIPHFYVATEADVTDLLVLRRQLNGAAPESHVSVNDMIIRATALALVQVPALNGTSIPTGVRLHSAVHMGVAVATEQGLLTPVVRDCHLKSVGRIAAETAQLIQRARERTLTAAELQGGTFTISNMGMYDVADFAAIINPPQVAILAVAQAQERPLALAGLLLTRQVLKLTVSGDHRALDGVIVARFLQALKALLERPQRLLL